MGYVRKTKDAAELSAACRRAALSRKSKRGGRHRLPYNDVPTRTLKVAGRDFEILRSFANEGAISLKDAFHKLTALVVFGGSIRQRPAFRPDGWEYRIKPTAA